MSNGVSDSLSRDEVASLSGWWLGETAARTPDAPALWAEHRWISYRELAQSSRDFATALASIGVSRGTRVSLSWEPSRGCVEAIHACQRIGALLDLLPLDGTEADLTRQAAATRPHWIVADEANAARAAGVATTCGAGVMLAGDLASKSKAPAVASEHGGVGDAQYLVCTSGTTGRPKAAVLTRAAVYASAISAAQRLTYAGGQIWLCALPLHHVAGLSVLLRAAIVGAGVVLRRRFDAAAFRADVERFDVRHASVVPTMLHRLVAAASEDPAGAKPEPLARCRLLVGGAALSPELAMRAHARGFALRATYGLTETSSQIATAETDEDVVAYPGAVGRALDGVRLAIEAPDRDGFGAIRVMGPQLFAGYFDDEAATCTVFRDGWFATGDTGRLDVDGRLYVSSRRTDLIVSGGENVRPEEVERVLEAHPAVAEAGVFGLADEEWGEIVAAVVVARHGAHIDAEDLVDWCRARLAGFKIPRRIETSGSLPRTANGKLMRAKLRSVC